MRLALLCAVPLAAAVSLDAAPAKPGAGRMIEATPGDLVWGGAPSGLPPGAEGVRLEGDPSKPGYFAVRVKAPAGYKIMPHTHPAEERITVVEGTFYLGMGERWDESALKAYPVGSYVSMPRGHAHFAFFKDGGVIQLASVGPWGIDYIDPKDDPRKSR